MAIIEIAKIQVRRGDAKLTGKPGLDSGEFGWAVAGTSLDSNVPELYIGNGTEAEGGRIGQGVTRILTEHDNVVNLFAPHSYTYAASFRSPINLDNVADRTVQSKLDELVNVYDFGETVTSATLQNAINNLFLNYDKGTPASGVALRIPAGEYLIDDTILIPPYATLLGDGQDKTVFTLTDSSKPLFQFCDLDSRVFGNTIFNSNSSPANINLIGLTLQYSTTTSKLNAIPLLRVDNAVDSYIFDCKFKGAYQEGNSSDNGYSGIEIRGNNAITTYGLLIDNCTFENLYYGIKSNYNIQDETISNSKFRELRRGIVFNETLANGNADGVLRTKMVGNTFEVIEREGIYVGTSAVPTYNSSLNNTFYDVGESGAKYPVINFLSEGNTSSGDNFRRFYDYNNGNTTAFKQLVNGKNYTDHNSVYSSNIVTSISTSTELVSFPYLGDQEYKVHYSVVKSPLGVSRKGDVLINVSLLGTNTTATITDSYTYSGTSDGGVEFSIALNTATTTVSLGYTSPDSVGTISYKFSQFQ